MNLPCSLRFRVAAGRCFPRAIVACASVAFALAAVDVTAASVTVRPGKDTTIYGPGNAELANGGGAFLFAGSSGANGGGRPLRSLIAFTLADQVPAGARIDSVTLTFTINTPLNNANTVRLHRVLADWGEGTARAGMGEGGGATAGNGDATWTSRMLGAATWTMAGGDFAPTASASQRVAGTSGTATFSTAGMVADVQAWVATPASNFGWILVAEDENGAAVRFASRQGSPAPTLVINYTEGGGGNPGGDTAPTIATHPASQSVTTGAAVTFTVAASGTPAPTYQWRKDNNTLAGATAATLALTNVSAADAGAYTVVVSNAAGSVTSNPATLTVNPAGGGGGGSSTARLSNLSVRAAMAADQTGIVGFSVSGGSRPILVRGVGPTLGSLGLGGTMTDPRLELYNGATLVAENNDWGDAAALSTAFTSVGAFSFLAGSRDAALLQTIDGTRSVHLKGTGPGVALVELYDTGPASAAKLVNVSARNQVGTGDNILIFGFFIDGTGSKNVLIRAIGPRLADPDFGLTGVLSDPRFDVFRAGTAAAIATNDNWNASLAPTFASVGAFTLTAGSRDAALVTNLTPGAYTVQVSGVNNTTGEALVEIYELP